MVQRVESTGKGGDRSIDGFYSRLMLTVFFVKESEKENKRKGKEIKHVVGGEGDESGEENKSGVIWKTK